VTFVSNGATCKGALVRDVVMFILTMIVVYVMFHHGTISLYEIHLLVIMYFGYVLVVLAADVYHRHVVLPRRILAMQEIIKNEETTTSEVTPLASVSRERRSYSVSDAMGDETPPKTYRRYRSDDLQQATRTGPPHSLEIVIEALSNYDVETTGVDGSDHISERDGGGGEQEMASSERTASGWGQLEEDGTEPLMVFHPHHGGMVDLKHIETTGVETLEVIGEKGVPTLPASRAPHSWAEAFSTAWPELVDCFRKFWRETYYNDEYNVFDKFLMTCELPFMIARMVRYLV